MNQFDQVLTDASVNLVTGRILQAAYVGAMAARVALQACKTPLPDVAPVEGDMATAVGGGAFYNAFHEFLHGGEESEG